MEFTAKDQVNRALAKFSLVNAFVSRTEAEMMDMTGLYFLLDGIHNEIQIAVDRLDGGA